MPFSTSPFTAKLLLGISKIGALDTADETLEALGSVADDVSTLEEIIAGALLDEVATTDEAITGALLDDTVATDEVALSLEQAATLPIITAR